MKRPPKSGSLVGLTARHLSVLRAAAEGRISQRDLSIIFSVDAAHRLTASLSARGLLIEAGRLPGRGGKVWKATDTGKIVAERFKERDLERAADFATECWQDFNPAA